jgi:Yip1 domain
MSEEGAGSPPGAASSGGPDSAVGRLVGVFFSPLATFDAIAKRPSWVLPLILWLGLAAAGSALLLPRLDWASLMKDQAEKRGQTLSERDAQDQVARMSRFFWLFDAIAVLFAAFALLGTAALFFAALQAFGREVRFAQSLAVTSHAFMPHLIGYLVFIPVVLTTDKIRKESAGDLVRSNLGFLADAKTSPALHSLLQSVDVFSLWTIALLTIGLASAARLPRGRSAALVVTLWLLFVLGKAGVAAVFG